MINIDFRLLTMLRNKAGIIQ